MSKQLALTNGNGTHARARVKGVNCARGKRIRQWHGKFLRALAKSPSVTIAAKAAGVHRRTIYNARESDPVFREAFESAVNQSVDKLEHEVFQRALKGDSQLAMFVLKAFRPFYRDSSKLEVDTRLCGVLLLPQKEDLPP